MATAPAHSIAAELTAMGRDPLDALTERQREIYGFAREKIVARGYGPTVREIGAHFGIRSPNGVQTHLKALAKKGLIVREPGKSRAISLTEPLPDRGGVEALILAADRMLDATDNDDCGPGPDDIEALRSALDRVRPRGRAATEEAA